MLTTAALDPAPTAGTPAQQLFEAAHGRCLLISEHEIDLAATPAAPWIPGLRRAARGPDAEGTAPAAPVLRYEDAAPPGLSFRGLRATVRIPWEHTDSGAQLGYVAAVQLERDRQRRGYFTLHAASAALGPRGVLLLGKEGAGKTSVLGHLCRSHGAELIGNDLSVVGGRGPRYEIAAGTRFLFLRQASVDRSMAALGLPRPERDGLDPWRTKWIVEPEQVSIPVADGPRPLDAAFLVHADETQRDLRTGTAADAATLLHLYENAARYIRGTATHVLHGTALRPLGYLPSLDTEPLYRRRAAVIGHLAHELGIRYVSGPAGAIAEYIARHASNAESEPTPKAPR